MNGVRALREAVRESMASNPGVRLLGEAVELSAVTAGLASEHPGRVLALPASDSALIGVAVGMALGGAIPVVELAGPSSLWGALQQLGQEASGLGSHPEFSGTLVVRVPAAPGSIDLGAVVSALPGVRVGVVGQPGEGALLLKAALASRGATVIIEPQEVLAQTVSDLAPLSLGSARKLRDGDRVSLLAVGAGVAAALAAAEQLAAEGIGADVLDLRGLSPLDEAAIAESVSRTGRVVGVGEARVALNSAVRGAFLRLEAPPASAGVATDEIVGAARAALAY